MGDSPPLQANLPVCTPHLFPHLLSHYPHLVTKHGFQWEMDFSQIFFSIDEFC